MSDTDTAAPRGNLDVSSKDEAARRVREKVEDALELAKYVVETGVKGSDGEPLAFADIAKIHETAGLLGILDVKGDGGRGGNAAAGSVTNGQWIAFEEAYYRLAMATGPVNAETLRNTKATSRMERDAMRMQTGEARSVFIGIADFVLGYSPALRFTRVIWIIAIFFAVFVIIAEWQINVLGLREDAVSVKPKRDLWQALQPWAYGGLGACASLLRSAHYFIYQRCFDVRRKPEYLNRILLGSISGGAIILFTNYLVAADDTFTHFGSAALGFIAGYSTDFLFNTIERIVTAIFPKVAVETVPRDSSQTPASAQPKRPRRSDQPDANDLDADEKPKPKE